VGWGIWGVGVGPVFSENPQQPNRSFSGILSNCIELFPETSARDLMFFYNPQQLIHCFSGILSNEPEVFLKLPASDPIIFGKCRLLHKTFLENFGKPDFFQIRKRYT